MDIKLPLQKLKLIATSQTDDLSFVVLKDVAHVVTEQKLVDCVRLIGGHMVTLHVHRWNLGKNLYRETVDADLGIQKFAMNQIVFLFF